MTLAALQARRAELLKRCQETDRRAAELREKGEPLDLVTRAGFEALDELRVLEHQLAKLKERK